MERIDAVVIGGGQSGLVMSQQLGRLGVEHVVLERGRIAERWRSERWDSLVFQFPNWMLRLPGHTYQGDEPDAFMPCGGIVRFLDDYARAIAPPIRCGVRVTGLQLAPSGRWRVQTDSFGLEARHVVVATGPYQRPVVPAFSQALPRDMCQLTANCYTRASHLPEGGVLVVGSGGSGWQIAEDLMRTGRRVYLSVGRHRRVPRRYRGKDFGWWQEQTGAADQVVDDVLRALPAPLLSGVDGGHDADLRDLSRRGATLLGSLGTVRDGRLHLVADLEDNLASADESYAQFTRGVDAHVAKHGLCVPEAAVDAAEAQVRTQAISAPSELDVKAAGIRTVIWAVGYQYDFGWMPPAVLDDHGTPVHKRGVSPNPGLCFLGLPRLHKVKSAFLWGVGDDAAYLAAHIHGSRS